MEKYVQGRTAGTALIMSNNGKTADMVTFARTQSSHQSKGGELGVTTVSGSSAKIMSWGNRNALPYQREMLIADNNIIPQLINTRRSILIGSGPLAYERRFENGKQIREQVEIPTEAAEFFDQLEEDDYFGNASKNLIMHGGSFTEYVRNRGGEIKTAKSNESRKIRREIQDSKGFSRNFYKCGRWTKKKSKDGRKFDIFKIPAYTSLQNQKNFMRYRGDDLIFDDYYYGPAWWGSRHWISIANCIPLFHQANLDQGYNIRYHIEVPFDYFMDYSLNATTAEEIENQLQKADAAKADFLERINGFLAGVENSGKAIFTFYEINKALGKAFPGVKITPLNVDLKDEALLKLYDKSNSAVLSAMGTPPTIAAIETAGKLSAGSEMRNAFMIYTAIHSPRARRILMDVAHFTKKQNGWDKNIFYTFGDIEITKLDDNKDGQQKVMVDSTKIKDDE